MALAVDDLGRHVLHSAAEGVCLAGLRLNVPKHSHRGEEEEEEEREEEKEEEGQQKEDEGGRREGGREREGMGMKLAGVEWRGRVSQNVCVRG